MMPRKTDSEPQKNHRQEHHILGLSHLQSISHTRSTSGVLDNKDDPLSSFMYESWSDLLKESSGSAVSFVCCLLLHLLRNLIMREATTRRRVYIDRDSIASSTHTHIFHIPHTYYLLLIYTRNTYNVQYRPRSYFAFPSIAGQSFIS